MTLADELMGLIPIPTRKGKLVQVLPAFEGPTVFQTEIVRRHLVRAENERRVLEMMETGKDRDLIASELKITRNYVNRCYRKAIRDSA